MSKVVAKPWIDGQDGPHRPVYLRARSWVDRPDYRQGQRELRKDPIRSEAAPGVGMSRLPKHRGSYERPIQFAPAPWPWYEQRQAERDWEPRPRVHDTPTNPRGPR